MAESFQAVQVLLSHDKKKGNSVRLEELFWDHFIRYIASLILALTVLNVTVEFLRGGGIFCFPPTDNTLTNYDSLQGDRPYEFAPGQANYINNYCARIILITEYFPIYILLHGLFLLVPHSLWNACFRGDFGSFFLVINKLDHLREKNGEYHSDKYDLIAKLESEYKGQRWIFATYVLKLLLQLAVSVGSLGFSVWYFFDCELAFSFCCPDVSICISPETINTTCGQNISGNIPKGWPLDTNVPCIYTSLRILYLVQYADLCLLIIASLLILIGLIWCFVRHTAELGHKDIAKFCFHSCLNEHFHSFPSPIAGPSYKKKSNNKKLPHYKLLWCCRHYLALYLQNLFRPRIRNDLDFLVLMLFRADTTHGKIFKSIQISKCLTSLVERDNQQLHQFSKLKAHSIEEVDPQKDSIVENPIIEENSLHSGCQSLPCCQTTMTEGNTHTYEYDSFHRYFLRCDISEKGYNPDHKIFHNNKKHLGNLEYVPELFSELRGVIYNCVRQFGPLLRKKSKGDKFMPLRNNLAVDISFGTVGFAPVLARPFKKVISLDISSHTKKIRKISHFYQALRIPENSYARNSLKIEKVQTKLMEVLGSGHIDFAVVGPIIESPRKVIVNGLLTFLFSNYGGNQACLLVVRPLKVGSKKIEDHFPKYEPPEELFRPIYKAEPTEGDGTDGQHQCQELGRITATLHNIRCEFELALYRSITVVSTAV